MTTSPRLRMKLNWKLDRPYLSNAERAELDKLKQRGIVTPFRLRACEGVKLMPDLSQYRCEQDVPEVIQNGVHMKRFCSLQCYNSVSKRERRNADDDDA